ncbi:MAG: hypothetical protein M3Y76_07730, partial [Chloroflexota bacterium]|nr:hypothetical protein [Chloroflexota bacterium]
MAVQPSQRTEIGKISGTQPGLLEWMQGMLGSLHKEPPLPPQPAMGFFTDTSLCIGCKACE